MFKAHFLVHRNFTVRHLGWTGLLVIVAVLPHALALRSENHLLQAMTARLPYIVILYAALSGGLVTGTIAGTESGILIYVVMSMQLGMGMDMTRIEHFAEVPFYVVVGAVSGYLRDHLRVEASEKTRVLNLFSRYVPSSAVFRILEKGVELGGVSQHATVLFADIRGFTALSEEMSPGETMHLLNTFFAEMTAIIFQHEGMLDKYIGDAIMAGFGVPLKGKHDAHCAIQAALQMLRRLREMNEQRAFGARQLRIGIGIHSGQVMAGNVGCAERIDYTVIGDTVNIAARLQELTKEFNVPIVTSAETIQEARFGNDRAKFLGDTRIRGRESSIQVYGIEETAHAGFSGKAAV